MVEIIPQLLIFIIFVGMLSQPVALFMSSDSRPVLT